MTRQVHGDATPTVRPAPDDTLATTAALRWQAERCRAARAPVAAAICDAVADDVESDMSGGAGTPGALAGLLPTAVRAGDQVGLRVMAVVHLLARTGQAPDVAVCLPTCGATPHAGQSDAGQLDACRQAPFARAVVDTLAAHPDEMAAGLARVPQTNEPGRCVPLRAVLTRVDMPIRLVELGTSAGLNLRADLLPGNPACEAGPIPPIVERTGCDLHPIDPATEAGRNLLHSYIWVDHVDRARGLDVAIDVACHTPATVVTADAGDTAAGVAVQPGTATVVWHSLVWGFLPAATRTRLLDGIDSAAAGAHSDAVLVHAAWEPLGDTSDRCGLTVRVWNGSSDDGVAVLAATGDHHGRSVALTGDWPAALSGALQ